MAAAPALLKSPSVTSLSVSSSTRKDSALKPNPHPYAIKTTSTALLTRSTSEYNTATHHYYVPLSPNPTRADTGTRHRATKSLTSMAESPTREAPRPLPVPPALDMPSDRRVGGYVSADEASVPRRRPRRSETMPVIPLPNPGLLAPPPTVEELPDNPKLWTPSQLAAYLTSALRVTSSNKPGEAESIGLPPLVAKDIAAFVKSARIGGRTFLRMNEEDFEALGMNKKWRQAILAALRNLRQNVLKGRIWGLDTSPTSSPSVESVSPDQIFSNPMLNSSSSSIESSSSFSSTGDADNGDAAGVMLGRSKARRYRNGRVRGMVNTFERSGSFSSEGGLEDGDTGATVDRTTLRRWVRQEGQVTGQSVLVDESPSPSRRRPLPVPPTFTGASSGPMVDEDEPTMEALLARMATAQPVVGARAWEEMDLAPGVTVKRVPSNESEADVSVDRTLIGSKSVSSLGSGRGSGGSSKGKPERRVVTAIFSPAAAELAVSAEAPSEEKQQGLPVLSALSVEAVAAAQELAESRPLPPLPDIPAAVASLDAQEIVPPVTMPEAEEPSHLERLLEAEITATRALLDTFRARLEAVEQKVAELEANEAQRDAELAALRDVALGPELRAAASVEIGVQSSSAMAVVGVQVQSDALSDAELAVPANVDKPDLHSDPAPGSSNAVGASTTSSSNDHSPSASSVASLQAVIPDVVRRLQSSTGLFSSPSPSASVAQPERDAGAVSRSRRRSEDKDEEPSSVSDLPSYVLLVGLGVCAVVLQAVFRKVVGRGAVGGWKP